MNIPSARYTGTDTPNTKTLRPEHRHGAGLLVRFSGIRGGVLGNKPYDMSIKTFISGPKFSEWTASKPNLSILGMAWAIWWRGYVLTVGGGFALYLASYILLSLFR